MPKRGRKRKGRVRAWKDRQSAKGLEFQLRELKKPPINIRDRHDFKPLSKKREAQMRARIKRLRSPFI